ncbi:hypothetical protein J6590_081734 [Homalodisca vitripennis]|nr:hypothetical protein J6590_081734 [Homalodisca vitripennis]
MASYNAWPDLIKWLHCLSSVSYKYSRFPTSTVDFPLKMAAGENKAASDGDLSKSAGTGSDYQPAAVWQEVHSLAPNTEVA